MVEIKEIQPLYDLKEEPKIAKEFQNWQLKIYEQMLGSGAFAKVFLGSYIKPENYVAVKMLGKDKSQMKNVSTEIKCLNNLNHQNIVSIYTYFQTEAHYYLIMELCRNGTLKDYLKRQEASQKLYYKIIHDILEGFRFVYQKNIMHRDLKADNILIDEKGNVKIADFGLSKIVECMSARANFTIGGSPFYTCKERIFGLPYSSKCDIFSLGVLIFEMIYGCHPYASGKKAISERELLKKYQENPSPSLEFPPDPPSMKVSEELKQLLTGMLKIDEKDRYYWNDVFEQFETEYNKFFKLDPSGSYPLYVEKRESIMFFDFISNLIQKFANEECIDKHLVLLLRIRLTYCIISSFAIDELLKELEALNKGKDESLTNLIRVLKIDAKRFACIYKEELEHPFLIEMNKHLKLNKENPLLNKREEMHKYLKLKIKLLLDNFREDFLNFIPQKDLLKIAFGLRHISEDFKYFEGNPKLMLNELIKYKDVGELVSKLFS